MIIGISTALYVYPDDEDRRIPKPITINDIKLAKWANINSFELSPYNEDISSEVKDYIVKNNMNWYSAHEDSRNCNISNINESKRRYSINDIKDRVDKIKKLNGKIVVIHPGWGWTDINEREDRIKNSINSLTEIVKYSAKKNIFIAIENDFAEYNYYTLGDNIGLLDSILKQVKGLSGCNEHIGVCLDTGHAFITGNLIDYINFFKNKIFYIHLHDNNGPSNKEKPLDSEDLHLIPGHGTIDWELFFNTLTLTNYKGGLVFEIMHKNHENKDFKNIFEEIRNFTTSKPFSLYMSHRKRYD